MPRSLFTTNVESASPSTSSAIMNSGRPSCIAFSIIGTRSVTVEIFSVLIRIKGFSNSTTCACMSVTKLGDKKPRSNCIPSTMSTAVSEVLPSSIVIAPSFPTFSMASATIAPMSLSFAGSLAAIEATCRISSCVLTARLCAVIASIAAFTALSIPIFSCIGSAPAVTFLKPS